MSFWAVYFLGCWRQSISVQELCNCIAFFTLLRQSCSYPSGRVLGSHLFAFDSRLEDESAGVSESA